MDPIARWHAYMREADPAALDALLAEEVVFRSPAVHTPQEGKAATARYLTAAAEVLGTASFRYVGEWRAERSAVLAFACEVDGLSVEGVDIIAWDAAGRITDFTVMIRPLKALHAVVAAMGAALARPAAGGSAG